MAATKSAKNPTGGNDTPNTPEVSESAIARMKVAELRRKLDKRGVKDTADLKKPELVKKLIKLETAEAKSGRSSSGRRKSSGGNDTPNTPEVSESAIARMKVAELRRELDKRGVKDTADLKKPELVKKLIKLETREAKSGRSTAKKSKSTAATSAPAATTKKSKSAAAASAPVPTTKKLRAAAMGRSTAKKLTSVAGKLPTTKKLLFAQTDLPVSDELPPASEVSEIQDSGSHGKSNSRKRTGKATAVIR